MHPNIFSILLLTLLLAATITPSSACSCIPPTIQRTYHDRKTVHYVRARVLSVRDPKKPFGFRRYVLKIQKNYKGCPRKGNVTVRTRVDSAACGVTLKIGRSYVLPLRRGKSPIIFLCDFISQFGKLTSDHKSFLKSRIICCKEKCTCMKGVPSVQCFRQPCSPPETCDVKGAKCTDNYCGGCFAEWFDKKGVPVCF